jgi:Zn-dependent peptidase ImmA (M78 family)/transcriptional regulator with XRE-family HTH domain
VARATIDVDPSLVSWAREAAGLTRQAAAKKVGVHLDKFVQWETPGAASRPTPRQLERLADAVKRPVATFFLPAPPVEPPLPADFRRPPSDEGVQPLSPATRLAIRRARRLQQVYVELASITERPPAKIRITRSTPPEPAARDARSLLGVTVAEQAQWHDTATALRQWRQHFERLGYLMFQFAMPPSEISGFSLADTASAIVLNKKDPPSRRCFTLFHEWAHLLLEEPGLCFVEEGRTGGTADAVEVFCNAFAGALLVPMDALRSLNALRAARFSLEQAVEEGVQQFAVSRFVILRRLQTAGTIDQQTYQKTAALWERQYQPRPKKKAKGGAPPYRKTVAELGRGFVSHVLRAHDRGQISDIDLSDYLSLKLRHIEKVEALVSGA